MHFQPNAAQYKAYTYQWIIFFSLNYNTKFAEQYGPPLAEMLETLPQALLV